MSKYLDIAKSLQKRVTEEVADCEKSELSEISPDEIHQAVLLADRMRKSVSMGAATATPATFATQSTESTGTVARVATVAVANPVEVQGATLSESDETAIRAFLDFIGEIDPVLITETLDRCASDPEAHAYFLWRSKEVPTPAIDTDHADAISCGQTFCGDCRHFRGPEKVCRADRCPTPLTLYRRCDLYKKT